MVAFAAACAVVEKALAGDLRSAMAADAAAGRNLRGALVVVRECMRSHAWGAGSRGITLGRLATEYDRRTREEGLHVLHDWDGTADRVNDESIPVDVLDFLAAARGDSAATATIVAILIDYYFLYVLALLSLRIWDTPDADANLDTLQRLLGHLQGPHGSGQRFALDAETLILIATSHYEPEERGYDALLERVRTLNARHRVNIALAHASAIGCHLRFGFEATYGRDTSLMRGDNVADYPWLCFALSTLMQEYARQREVDRQATAPLVEAMLNGLSADARALVGEAPSSLSQCAPERIAFRDMFLAYRAELLDAFAAYRPSDRAYSPLSLFFNFSHNALKGTVVDALLRGQPWPLAINALLTADRGAAQEPDSPAVLAVRLMEYARAAPDRIRGRLMPVIVYDPAAGRMAFSVTMQKLRQ